MELVSIIYSSLLVVFSLLGLVLITSYLYSKMSGTSNSQVRSRNDRMQSNAFNPTEAVHVIAQTEVIPENVRREVVSSQSERRLSNKEKAQIAYRAALSKSQIEQKLIANNNVRVVSKAENAHRESIRSGYENSVSRYSVVNSFARESRASNDIYSKFSKMSVEYSKGY
ncbi:MAG: hypothetical protein PF445_07575 [Melioribacteraceae bacterium]|jgi:hypothetical protein|nr:hypothetical protein [Melioribacteraceae bacterium]